MKRIVGCSGFDVLFVMALYILAESSQTEIFDLRIPSREGFRSPFILNRRHQTSDGSYNTQITYNVHPAAQKDPSNVRSSTRLHHPRGWDDSVEEAVPMLPDVHRPLYPVHSAYNHHRLLSSSSFSQPKILRFAIISDMDEDAIDASEKGRWKSVLNEGNLYVQLNRIDPSKPIISIQWDEEAIHTINSGYSFSLRGMELSTLNVYNGKLYACDDRTGIVYQLNKGGRGITPIPWAILADGNFTGNRGFKCEWATIKDGDLFIGGIGVDRRDAFGVVTNTNNLFIKRVSPHGEVTHIDWSRNFEKMSNALNIQYPGYVIHEAGGWSNSLKKWMFMPRKVSHEKFEPAANEQRGSNVVLLADENFDNIEVGHIGELIPTHGFAGFKWIPGTNDQVVLAIKSLEFGSLFETYIMAFDLNGHILLPETKIADHKFEGIEFL